VVKTTPAVRLSRAKRGATMVTDHLNRRQKLTVIDVEDLKEFRSSMNEEFWTFSVGNFLFSGAAWLGEMVRMEFVTA
jgi:hypothetical protein